MMFVDATPGSELARKCRSILKEAKLKIRVVEKSGTSVKQVLSKSYPLGYKCCIIPNCLTCETCPEIRCSARDAVYKISCKGCRKGVYVGETSRTLGERVNEHLRAYNNSNAASVFHKHVREQHNGEKQEVDVEIISTHPGDAMLRQVTEAMTIATENPELNRKTKFGNTNLPRRRRNHPPTQDVLT